VRTALILLAAAALVGGPVRGQPAPAPRPTSPDAIKGLFGEREPEDEETAAGQAQPDNPQAPSASAEAPSSQAYDARVRQSFAAAQAFQGSLDGGWIASWRGRDLMQLQLVDKGKGEVEGAWRDLREGASLTASGLLDPTPVIQGSVDARFGPEGRGALAYRLTVRPAAGGRLTGVLRMYDETFDVMLRRAP
jgi:hypothetical protein